MGYRTADLQFKENTQKILKDHESDLLEQKSLTKYFTIIVAATLVSTLVGLGGVYISVLSQSTKYEIDTKELSNLKNNLMMTHSELTELKVKIEIIKAKYPWIKDYGI